MTTIKSLMLVVLVLSVTLLLALSSAPVSALPFAQPTPVRPEITPIIPIIISPIIPVNLIPLHAGKHAADVPNSSDIVKVWKAAKYTGQFIYSDGDKVIHVLKVAGKWCFVVMGKMSRVVITAFPTSKTASQIHKMLQNRGFWPIK